jgi:Myb-like DNA-binding domain
VKSAKFGAVLWMCDSAALRLKHGCCPSQHSWLHDRTMQGDDDNDDALLAATTAAWGNPQAAWHTTGAEARVPTFHACLIQTRHTRSVCRPLTRRFLPFVSTQDDEALAEAALQAAAASVGRAPAQLLPHTAGVHGARVDDDDDDAWLRDQLATWQQEPPPAGPGTERGGGGSRRVVPAQAPVRVYTSLSDDDDEEEEEEEEDGAVKGGRVQQQPATTHRRPGGVTTAAPQRQGAARHVTGAAATALVTTPAAPPPRGEHTLPSWARAQPSRRRAAAAHTTAAPAQGAAAADTDQLHAALDACIAYETELEAALEQVRSRRHANAALRASLTLALPAPADGGGASGGVIVPKRRRRGGGNLGPGGALAEPIKTALCRPGRGPAAHGGTSRFFRAPESCTEGPGSNVDAQQAAWKAAQSRLPLSIQQRPWSEDERRTLRDAVAWHLHQAAMKAVMQAAEAEGRKVTLQEVQAAKPPAFLLASDDPDTPAAGPTSAAAASHQPAPFVDVSSIDWEAVRQLRLPGRTANECLARWTGFEDPQVNTADAKWTASEDKDLARMVEEQEGHDWQAISDALYALNKAGTRADKCRALKPRRSPAACLRRYQTVLRDAEQRFGGQRPWTAEEDERLKALLVQHGYGSWSVIGQALNRNGHQIQHRAKRMLVPGKKKGRWDAAEDEVLLSAVATFGVGAWARVAAGVPGRTDVQCRERYVNCLAPGLDKTPWRDEEDDLLRSTVAELRGSDGKVPWAKVALKCDPRTDYQCACRWEQLHKRGSTSKRKKKNGSQSKGKKRKRTAQLASSDSEGEEASDGVEVGAKRMIAVRTRGGEAPAQQLALRRSGRVTRSAAPAPGAR